MINTTIDEGAVDAIRARCDWRSSSPGSSSSGEESTYSRYDKTPKSLEPGCVIYMRAYDQIRNSAIVKTDNNLKAEGFHHPLLIVHRDAGGLLYCLTLTSFHNAGCLKVPRGLEGNYRLISHDPERESERNRNVQAAGKPLRVNFSLDRGTSWINQSQLIRVEPDCTKIFRNGTHKLARESLDTIRGHCESKLRYTFPSSGYMPRAYPQNSGGASPERRARQSNWRTASSWRSGF